MISILPITGEQRKDVTVENSVSNKSISQAKDYVTFYYFWLLQYYLRLKKRIILEKRRRIISELQELPRHVKPLRSESAKGLLLVVPDESYSNCRSVSLDASETIPDYISSPCSLRDWCINSGCNVKEKVISIIDDYNYKKFPDLNIKNSNIELAYRKDHELFSDDIIYIVLNKGGLSFFFENSGYVDREIANHGIEVLGYQNVFLSNDGTLGGKLVVALDLSSPTPFLMYDIQRLKSHPFKKTPDFAELTSLTNLEARDYLLEKSLIESIKTVSSSPEQEKDRAIGLWLYDVIDVSSRFSSVETAWQAMKDGIWSKEAEAALPEDKQVFKFPLKALGHADSGPEIFTLLYSNTKKCIEACEVMSLTAPL